MKHLSPHRKRLVLASLISLLLFGSALLYVGILSFRPFQIPAPAALPSPNGFDVYVAAARAVVPANPPVDKINDTRQRTPEEAATLYSPQRRRAWISSNTAAWTLMAQAKGLPCRAPNVRGVITTVPAWTQLRELARCQSIRVKEASTSGNWGEGINLGLDTLEMGRNVERGSVLIGSLVGMAVEAIGQRSIEDIPSHLSALQARAAAGRLETLMGRAQPFSQVLTEEKWNMAVMLKISGGAILGAVPFQRANESMMDDLIAQADKPMRAQVPQAAPTGLTATSARIEFPVMKRSFFNDERRNANERLLLLRLALRAYRVERGSYPANLSALAPTYLKTIPADPFGSGETLRYRTSSDDYTIWSIGPDGIDNQGVPVRPKNSQKRAVVSPNSTGDVVAHERSQ